MIASRRALMVLWLKSGFKRAITREIRMIDYMRFNILFNNKLMQLLSPNR